MTSAKTSTDVGHHAVKDVGFAGIGQPVKAVVSAELLTTCEAKCGDVQTGRKVDHVQRIRVLRWEVSAAYLVL